MQHAFQVIKTIAVTEKSTDQTGHEKYTFFVDRRANKVEIRQAIEQLFERKVASVNVMNCLGKSRRTRYGVGKRPDWKKAIVTLAPDQEPLNLF